MAGRPDKEPRTVLEYLLWQQDRTYEEAADEFERLAASMRERATMSPRHLRRIASGERPGASTTPVTRRVLQAMFGMTADALLAPYEPGSLPSVTQGVIIGHAQPDTREMLDMAANRAKTFLLTGQTTLSAEGLEQVHDDVRHLARAYPQRPLTEILGSLVSTQDTLFTLIEQRQRPAHSRQLYFLSGIVGGMLAKASHDMGDPHMAMTQARTAFLCADHADHNGLRAWIRGLQALVTYWDGRPRESVRYAQQGSMFAQQTSSTSAVWLAASEARAWASLGNATDTRSAIERAESAWDRVTGDELDELGGLCTFGRARTLYYAADALSQLPSEAESAQDYSLQAVQAYEDTSNPEWAFGDQAGSRADLAVSRISLGEIEGAAEALTPVLELPPEQRINGVIRSAKNVHRALKNAHPDEAVSDLQEQIEVFSRTPLKAIPQ